MEENRGSGLHVEAAAAERHLETGEAVAPSRTKPDEGLDIFKSHDCLTDRTWQQISLRKFRVSSIKMNSML